jgi:hypothetical protein
MFSRKSPLAIVASAVMMPLLLVSGCGGGSDPSPVAQTAAQPEIQSAATVGASQDTSLPKEDHQQQAAGEGSASSTADGHAPLLPNSPAPADAVQIDGIQIGGRQIDALAAVSETIRLASTYTPLVSGTIHATAYWPVWYGTGKPVDGVNCLINGNYHKHVLISIYSNGKRLGFPDGIGRVHAGCYHAYEMHVHDVTGIIHMEADVPKVFKLGQWFSLWKQPLSRDMAAGLAGPVRFYIIENGTITRYDGDPYQITLSPHREVLIVTGTVMTVVPKYQWPAGV